MRRRTVLAGRSRGGYTQVGCRAGTVLATSSSRDAALLESLNCIKRKLETCLFLILLPSLVLSVGLLSERTLCGSKQSKSAAVSFQERGIPLERSPTCSKNFPMSRQGDDCYFYFYSTCTKVWVGFFSFAWIFFLFLVCKRKGWSRGRPTGDVLPSQAVGFCARC